MHTSFKTALTVVGAVTVLVLAGNTVALATTGKALLAGKINTSSKVTALARTTPGTALQVRTKRTTDSPLAVNGRGKVVNLNADTLDGKDSTALGTRALVWSYAGTAGGAASRTFAIQVPAGRYLFSYEVYLNTTTYPSAGALDCYLKRVAGPLYAAESITQGNASYGTAANGVGTIIMPTAGEVQLFCRGSAASTWEFSQDQPLRITAVPIDTLTNKGFPATD